MSVRHLLILILFTVAIKGRAQVNGPDPATWGARDTIAVQTIFYNNEWMPYREMEMVYVGNMSQAKLARAVKAYNRLRNAVYVTYHYARNASVIINEANTALSGMSSSKERKAYLKTKEADLKKQFTEPLSNLSVYQGKVLMKLINRHTGNNCYELIKEYRGGFDARMYQTVAFVFGSNLKQDFDLSDATDQQIEAVVKEIEGTWYQNPNRPGMPVSRR